MKNSLKFKDLGVDFFAHIQTQRLENSSLIHVNESLRQDLNFNITDKELLEICSGEKQLAQENPISTVYAGHQFGNWAGQLGDGRALLIGELLASDGARFDLQLKGSGPTPWSRGGDGRSPLGPVLREYLVSEAMATLGVPTTRALAAVSTGEQVRREQSEPGARDRKSVV